MEALDFVLVPTAPATTAELQANPFKRGTKVRLVDDIPGEIMLHPNLWGEVRFQTE